ncbi:hypothetical protein C8R45DRAFT_245650 [Mycena sanguinolenta]|nr:hypothetical protein C8R45DRAFT_245650 [Mycena sanguinolenta]
MRVPELANNPSRSFRGRLAPLLVSQTFNRLGLPHCYAHIRLWNPPAVTKLAPVLLKNPSIGPRVRSLVMRYWEPRVPTIGTDGAMLTVLSSTTGLMRLSQTLRSDFVQVGTIPWSAFEAVGERTSSTLRELSFRIDTVEATQLRCSRNSCHYELWTGDLGPASS